MHDRRKRTPRFATVRHSCVRWPRRVALKVVFQLVVMLVGGGLRETGTDRADGGWSPGWSRPQPPHVLPAMIWQSTGPSDRVCCVPVHVRSSLRLAGGASGLGWIERRLNSVFNSASKASGSPSGGPFIKDEEPAVLLDTQTPVPGKTQLWDRFERGFDSLQSLPSTVRKDPFRSLSPLSSPEGPHLQGYAGDESSTYRASPKAGGSWFARRFSDAFASDAPSPADASHWSHASMPTHGDGPMDRSASRRMPALDGESCRGMSTSSATRSDEWQQRKHPQQTSHTVQGARTDHTLQPGSEVSEEISGGVASHPSSDKASSRNEQRSAVDDSFMLRMPKKERDSEAASDSGRRCSVDDIGLPTPLRAEWGPSRSLAPQTAMDAGWELPSITLAMQDTAAAVRDLKTISSSILSLLRTRYPHPAPSPSSCHLPACCLLTSERLSPGATIPASFRCVSTERRSQQYVRRLAIFFEARCTNGLQTLSTCHRIRPCARASSMRFSNSHAGIGYRTHRHSE